MKQLCVLMLFGSLVAPPAFAAATLPPVTDATKLTVTPPNNVRTTVGAAIGNTQTASRWRGIARRAQLGGPGAPSIADFFRATVTSRVWEQTPTNGPIDAIQFRYCNSYFGLADAATDSTGGEVANANPITVSAGVEINPQNAFAGKWLNGAPGTQVLRMTFNGQASVVLPPAACAFTDPLYVSLPAATPYYVRSTCTEPVGTTCPAQTLGQGATNYEGNNSGTSKQVFTASAGQTGFSYTVPAALTPIVPGSLSLFLPSSSTALHDNGTGGCTTGSGLASCSVNYTTGAVSFVLSSGASAGASLAALTAGGPAAGDQTTAVGLSNFYLTDATAGYGNFGPIAIGGRSIGTGGARIHTLGLFTDSLGEGNGNSQRDTSWIDYSVAGSLGIVKGSASGEEGRFFAATLGHRVRGRAAEGLVDRILSDYATNDLNSGGQSLSQIINSFLALSPMLASWTASQSASQFWYFTMPPRTTGGITTPLRPLSGPYTADGAAYGPGAVLDPTPLGGAYNSGVIGHGIQACVITGTGGTGPYTCSFGRATMVGALWTDGGVTTVVDSGSGGDGVTPLTGSGVAAGSITPGNGTVSLTLSSALPNGATITLYDFAAGPSARNAWNYFLYNWALPLGWIGGIVDLAAALENAPNSALGAGSGTWTSATLTADDTHPSPLAHQVTIPQYLGPAGSNPSGVWSFAP